MTPVRTSGMVVSGVQDNHSPKETLIKLVQINTVSCSKSLEIEGFTTNGETLIQQNLWKLSGNGRNPWNSSPSSHSSALWKNCWRSSAIAWQFTSLPALWVGTDIHSALAGSEHGQIPFSILLCCKRSIASEWWQLGGIHFLTHNFHYVEKILAGQLLKSKTCLSDTALCWGRDALVRSADER